MALPIPPDTDSKNPPNITPGSPTPVTILTPLSELKKKGFVSDQNLLNLFKADPVNFIREVNLIYYQKERVRLKQLIDKFTKSDHDLFNAWESAKAQLPNLRTKSLVLSAKPVAAQPQPAVQPTPEIPQVTAEELTKPTPEPPKKNEVGSQNAPQIEKFLNDFKPKFDAYMAEKRVDAATSAHAFTQNLMGMLAMYRGDLSNFYLTEGAKEMLFSALGPIGDLWRAGEEKKYSLQMAWMKNPLNPNAIYFYLNSLPAREAFKVLYLPVKATWAILTHGGAPLTTRATYIERHYDPEKGPSEVVKQGNFFSPKLRTSQAADIVADGLVTRIGPMPSHDDFAETLNSLKVAKLSGNKNALRLARRKIRLLLDQTNSFSGAGGFFQAILRKGLINTYRRLKRHERDPISYLFSILSGSIFDLIMTVTVRPLAVIANKLINLVPGVNVLRAQLAEFFSSSRYLTTARIGGASISSFIKGVFSPTTFSFGFVGYNLSSNPIAQAILTPSLAGLGAFYKTAVNLANLGIYNVYGELNPVGWVKRYDALVAKGDLQTLKEGYLKGFKPGPITRLANFLHTHWYARVPINGWVAADFLSPMMQRLYGWTPTTTHIVFTAADYFWQIKGPLFKTIGNFVSRIPFVQSLITQFQFGITFPLKNWWFNAVYKATAFQQSLVGAIPTQWKMRTWAKFGQTFFNPGFFMGFGMVPWLSTFMPVPLAYVAAPIAGSLAWNMAAYTLERTFGMKIASMTKINAWGWTGYLIGSLLQLVIPGLPSWFSMLTAGLGVATGMILSTTWASNLLLNIGTRLLTAIPALAGATGVWATAIAAWSTIMAIGSVALLTVFFGYTIYAGFWVPMMERAKAGEQSENFSINSTVEETAPNKFQVCSNFTVSENTFNSAKYLIHETDFHVMETNLTVDLTDPEQAVQAFRNQQPLKYTDNFHQFTSNNFLINNHPTYYPLIIGWGWTVDHTSMLDPVLQTWLATPDDQPTNLYNLMSTNQSVVYSLKPFFDILEKLAQEHNQTAHLIDEYNAQLDLMDEEKNLVDDLIARLEDNDLNGALEKANGYLNTKPMGDDPCPDPPNCPVEKQGLKDLFDSWRPTVENYVATIQIYLNQTNPSFESYLTNLRTKSKILEQQVDLLPDVVDQMEDVEKKMDDADAIKIQAIDFLNFPALTNVERRDIWDNLLAKYFPDIFKESVLFYFIPSGTNYRVCVQTEYCRVIDPVNPPDCPTGKPVTVCSTIGYRPSFFSARTSFATSCSTFTP